MVSGIDDTGVICGQRRMASRTVIWAGVAVCTDFSVYFTSSVKGNRHRVAMPRFQDTYASGQFGKYSLFPNVVLTTITRPSRKLTGYSHL
jgi:hypothetical protein